MKTIILIGAVLFLLLTLTNCVGKRGCEFECDDCTQVKLVCEAGMASSSNPLN